MGKAQYLLQRDVGREEADIQSKYQKRSLWSKIGMGVGGLLAMGLTGGAAAPIVAGLMAAGGTYAGGKLGDVLARQTGARIKGKGKFFKGQREGLVSRLGQDIAAGSLKAGLGAGMTQLGAGLKLGKGGLSVSTPGAGIEYTKAGGVTKTGGFKFGDIFAKRGTPTGTYGEGLMGKLGKAMDVKGSFIGGKALPAAKRAVTNLRGDIATGFENKTMDWSSLEGSGLSPKEYQSLVGERQAAYDLSEQYAAQPAIRMQAEGRASDITTFKDPEQYARREIGRQIGPLGEQPSLQSSELVVPTEQLLETPIPQYKTKGFKAGMQRILPGGESGYQTDIPMGQGLSAEEVDIMNYYDKVRSDKAYPTFLSDGKVTSSDPTHISRKMPQSTLLKDVGVGENFLESSNIRNTPRYVAGRHGEESYFSRALDTDDISPMDIRGGNQGITMPEIKHIEPNRRAIPGTGSYSSYGGGTGSTGTNAWEGVGESFPVTSPDLVGDIGGAYTQSPAYDYRSAAAGRHKLMSEDIRWQDRLFGGNR